MSTIYDNWERLVAAVLRREQLWQLCHQNSISSSLTSSFSSNFSLNSQFPRNSSFNFSNQKRELPKHGHSLPFHALARIKVRVRFSQNLHFIVFSDDSPFTFEAETLLNSPSDNLGEEIGTFGGSYVVSLGNDFIVVRRLMVDKLSREILEQQLKMFGKIVHENLVNQRGYYFYELYTLHSFGIYDYFRQGSVSSMLYGKGDQTQVQLDWDTRIRIAIGAARGLAHIHKQCGGRLVHGNVKASNIFINSQGYGCLADLNLTNFLNPSAPTVITLRGYRPPEAETTVSQASDVYSFGVFLLELLGGKSPIHTITQEYGHWARHKARDDWMILVFDTWLLRIPTIKDEMQDMLNIALSCVEKNPDKRPNMESVAEMLDRIID
ncbi:hypothetical protein DH2020_009855 [Rehmannia glutinosa]|uniref:Protein kinase domain-containing protein n=1 Tax=Rehmannia glutinosa TaxID=99300 RepID=A0ABR0X9N2_REHGL